MTTLNGVPARLPHYYWRHNRHTPTTDREFAQWAIEELVSLYGDTNSPVTDEEALLDVAYWTHCRHLAWAEFMERIERLCALSRDCDEWQDKPGERARRCYEELQDDYRTTLAGLVTRPSDDMCAVMDAVTGERRPLHVVRGEQ